MRKFVFILLIFHFISIVTVHALDIYRISPDDNKPEIYYENILLIYSDQESDPDINLLKPVYLMLRRYCKRLEISPLSSCTTLMLDNADAVFIAGTREIKYNPALEKDLISFSGLILWGGPGIENYKKLSKDFDISYSHEATVMSEYPIMYDNNIVLPAGDDITLINYKKTEGVKIWGNIYTNANNYPFAVKSGAICLMASLHPAALNVAAGVLNSIFYTDIHNINQTCIMLTSTGPFSDLEKLKSISNWMEDQGVPFIIELAPVFNNGNFDYMKQYAATIRQMIRCGGSPVLGNLKGWKPKPDGWDQSLEMYSENVTDTEAAQLLYQALQVYLEYEIFPVAFSGSPDLFFANEYSEIMDSFSLFIQGEDWYGTNVDLKSHWGWKGTFLNSFSYKNTYLPEKNQVLMSDYAFEAKMAGTVLTIDANGDMENIMNAVQYLKRSGFKFLDLKKTYDSQIEFNDIHIANKNGMIYEDGHLVNQTPANDNNETGSEVESPIPAQYGRAGSIENMISYILIVVTVFIVLFIIVFISNKIIDKRKHVR